MRVVVPRCKNASCKVDDKITGKIDDGYLLLVGFTNGDNEDILSKKERLDNISEYIWAGSINWAKHVKIPAKIQIPPSIYTVRFIGFSYFLLNK